MNIRSLLKAALVAVPLTGFTLPLQAVTQAVAPKAKPTDIEQTQTYTISTTESPVLSHKPELEKVTYLGVMPQPVPEVLWEQLQIPEGTGLVVNKVMPDSPAAALLKPNDVLTKLDDQILVNPPQLTTLIRLKKPGEEVTLTFIRAGKQTTGKVKLVEREMPKHAMFDTGMGFVPHLPAMAPDEARHIVSVLGSPAKDIRVFDRRKGLGAKSIHVRKDLSKFVFTDDDGTLELTLGDGIKNLVAKDAKNKVIFDGPINTPEERKAVPESVLPKLEKLESTESLKWEE